MSFGFCPDERDHERKAEDDARYHRRDYEYYDRYSNDPCKQVYTEKYDSEVRSIARREEAEAEERAEMQRMERRQFEREAEENRQFYEEQPCPEVEYPEPPIDEQDGKHEDI